MAFDKTSFLHRLATIDASAVAALGPNKANGDPSDETKACAAGSTAEVGQSTAFISYPREREPLDLSRLEPLITRLLALRRAAEPRDDDDKKEASAKEALWLAAVLMECIAGWAIDHFVGRGIQSEGKHRGAAAESLGWALRQMAPIASIELPAEQQRAAILALIEGRDETRKRGLGAYVFGGGSTFIPEPLASILGRALRALDHGEVQPVLQPRRTQRRGARPLSLAVTQLALLDWAEYQYGRRNMSKIGALKAVASGVGRDVEAIRQWRKALPRVLGREAVEHTLAASARGLHGDRVHSLPTLLAQYHEALRGPAHRPVRRRPKFPGR